MWAVCKIFELYPDPDQPDQELLDLLKLSLENNDIIFNGEWFLQIRGTAMGKKFAPNFIYKFLVLGFKTGVLVPGFPLWLSHSP